MNNVKDFLQGSLALGTGMFASAVGPHDWSRTIPGIIGGAVALYSGYSIWRRNRREELDSHLKSIRERQDICEQCKTGLEPDECPYPKTKRPRHCKKTKV